MKLESGQTILFTGDSITDCGRAWPVGKGTGLGEGYVAFAEALLTSCYPERNIQSLNTGISGNTVIDLEKRWQSDVVDIKRDWLSIMIGINDVWRQAGLPANPDHIDIELYESTYRNILEQVRSDLKGLVLMTPYIIEPDRKGPMRERMDAYGKVVEKLASEFDAVFISVQDAFDLYLESRPAQSLCDDRIHPNKTGHMIIARSFLTGIEFDWGLAETK